MGLSYSCSNRLFSSRASSLSMNSLIDDEVIYFLLCHLASLYSTEYLEVCANLLNIEVKIRRAG